MLCVAGTCYLRTTRWSVWHKATSATTSGARRWGRESTLNTPALTPAQSCGGDEQQCAAGGLGHRRHSGHRRPADNRALRRAEIRVNDEKVLAIDHAVVVEI